MLKRLLIAGMVAGVAVVAGPEGEWNGGYTSTGSGGTLDMRVKRADSAWSIELMATSEHVPNPQFRPAQDVRVSGDSLWFTMPWGTPVHFNAVVKGDSMYGGIQAEHWSGRFGLKRRGAGESR